MGGGSAVLFDYMSCKLDCLARDKNVIKNINFMVKSKPFKG